MSRHIGRKEVWFKNSPLRYNSAYGFISKNSDGMWDGYVRYQVRSPLTDVVKERPWRKVVEIVGAYKREREAMAAVEGKVEELKKSNNEDILI
jgi:hypothetical protein